MKAKTYPEVRAVHRHGVLRLLDDLELPEGAQVWLSIESVLPDATETPAPPLLHPTRFVAVDRLDALTGLIEVGGDALAESEVLYDPDWN